MKKYIFLFSFYSLLFFACSVFAGGDHRPQTGTVSFRIDQAAVELSLEPQFYTPNTGPSVVVHLKAPRSGAAILNAELYLLLEAKQKHDMTGHQQPLSVDTSPAEDMELDFGAPPPSHVTVDLSAFKKLTPRQMAGMYAASFPPGQPGTYTFTLAIKSLDGRIFPEPLIYGGTVTYQPQSKPSFYRMIFGMAILLLSGLIAILLITFRNSLKLQHSASMNLLDIPWVKRFFGSRWYQPLFQVPTFIVFVVIIVLGIIDTQKGDRNIATLLTWTIWWAGVIFSFVLVGRIWCMMCPFGACQDWLGRRLSLNRNFPRPLRNIWLSTFLFIGLTWWDSYSGIVNNPAFTAYLLIGFTIVSSITALAYKGRTFCRYICPIGGLIGIYSMFSPVELRNRCLDVCRADKEKGCVRGTSQSYPCPMFETPMTLDRNNYCNLCSECIKSCAQDNIVLRFRSFARDLWVSTKGYMDEAYLIMVLVGLTILATAEMIGPWHSWIDSLIKLLPLAAFGVTAHAAQEKTLYTMLLVTVSLLLPSLLLLLTSTVVKALMGGDGALPIKKIFIRFSYMFIPVGLSMHLAHNVSHLLREGVQVVPAIQRALIKYAGMDLGTPDWEISPLIGLETLFWFQMATVLILNVFSLYAGYRISMKHFKDKPLHAFIPMAVLAIAFMLINMYVLGQPMALRHNH